MSSEYSGETASASAGWLWTVCVFLSGIVLGGVISDMLLYLKSSLVGKFRALLGHDLTSSQSRPSSQPVYRYDVFLSFRGPDVRHTFIDHLYNNLERKGIFTFRDDKRLEHGESISSQLLEAIKASRVAIVVFSKNYAGSTWCLEEMAAIADCRRESEQIVIPVFYDVEPSDVRRHKGAYMDAFLSLKRRFKRDKVHRLEKAMTDLANLSGHDVRNKSESTEIENIIEDVMKNLDHKLSADANDLIGIQPRVEKLEKLLKLNSDDDNFRIFGIWGMGGIGKTVNAKVLYDKISKQFDASCFIENVSKIYRDHGASDVEKRILYQTLREQDLEKYSPTRISGILRDRLCSRKVLTKVLIVLDNVDQQEQLEKLAINPKLLGTGSRVIITTRNKHILDAYGADATHEISLLNDDEARALFIRKAFKTDRPNSSSDENLTLKILKYAQSLPLAIKELGCFFCARHESNWGDALKSLRKYPVKQIMDVLQTSFDELNLNEQEIFLHVACFFKGERKNYVEHVLDSCGILSPCYTIQQIMEKSLLTIQNQEIHMHKMLEELGKKIVRGQHPEDPKFWNRLWRHGDFEEVLLSEMETNCVKAIVLGQKEDVSQYNHWWTEGLSKMRDLMLLILNHKNFSGKLNFLFKSLKYISWHSYPFPAFPLSEIYNHLVELKLPNSSIERLWQDNENIPNLKRLDMSYSKNLTKTPNFRCCQGLVRLDFTGCTNLTQVYESIGLLSKLDYLSLRDCTSLEILDLGSNCMLSSLRVLRLSGCTTLKSTPNFEGLSNLKYLDLERCTSLSTVHESIGALATLKFLSLRGCTNLVWIPMHINNVTSLLTLDLSGYKKLENLPLGHKVMSSSCLESLIFLDLGFSKLRRISNATGELRCLERLNLEGSYSSYVTDTIKSLSRLAYLNLSFDVLHPGRGVLEGYPHRIIIGQEYIFSAATN